MPSGKTDRPPKPRLIVIGPVPPPTHGVAISTQLALANPLLHESFSVEHIDTTDRRSLANIGNWDAANVALGLRHLGALIRRLRGPKGVVYLPLSQGWGGFARDSLFIHAAALAGWRVGSHLRGAIFRRFYEESNRIVRWWIRITLRRIWGVAVVGVRLRPIFDGFLSPERIAVVPNGTPDVAPQNGSRTPGRVLYLSNLVEDKGIVEAVEAALIIVRRNPAAEVVFAGEWDDDAVERELRERVTRSNGRIRFLSSVSGEAKEELFQSASVFLFPPKAEEGHPRVVLEAICRGIPLVTTDRGAIAETITHGESGLILADPDPGEIAESVLRLLDDGALRERMGSAARARYERDFTQETADRRLAEWLGTVARN